MNKKVAIIVSLILTIVFTLGIVWTANKNYKQVSRTVDVVQTTEYVPVGSLITENDIKMVPVQENMAKNMVTDKEVVIGKSPVVSLIKGQYIYDTSLSAGIGKQKGFVEVYIKTDVSSSAMATAGELVNIHLVDRSNRDAKIAPEIYKGARVLHSLDQQGSEITPGSKASLSDMQSPDGHVPVAIGIEVPVSLADTIVQYAHNDSVYLVKSDKSKQLQTVTKDNNQKKIEDSKPESMEENPEPESSEVIESNEED